MSETKEDFWFNQETDKILANLDSMRKEETLCDAVLETSDGGTFPVYRNFLAAASPVFKAMFAGNFAEAKNPAKPIVMEGITAVALQTILDCVHCGKLTLFKDSAFDVLTASHRLQLNHMTKACESYLVKNMSKSICFRSRTYGELFSLPDLFERGETYILSNFSELSGRKDFLRMKFDLLCALLHDERLRGKEIDIFRAVKAWLQYKPGRRSEHRVAVMKLINFTAMDIETLTDEVLSVEYMKTTPECFDMVKEAIKYRANIVRQPLEERFVARGIRSVVVLRYTDENSESDDDDDEDKSDDDDEKQNCAMTIFSASEITEWRDSNEYVVKITEEVTLDFAVARGSANLVGIGSFLFLFGASPESEASFTKRYDANLRRWIDLAAMPSSGKVGSTATHVAGQIIVVGGNKIDAPERNCSDFTDEVFSYSVEQNRWKGTTAFPQHIWNHAACTVNSLLCVAGGQIPYHRSKPATSAQLYAYDTTTETWLRKSDMNCSRSRCCMESIDGKLFVLGGERLGGKVEPSVEMYDSTRDQWTAVTALTERFSFYGAESFVHDNTIFTLGGVTAEGCSSKIYHFRPDRETMCRELPWEVDGHSCAILKIQL